MLAKLAAAYVASGWLLRDYINALHDSQLTGANIAFSGTTMLEDTAGHVSGMEAKIKLLEAKLAETEHENRTLSAAQLLNPSFPRFDLLLDLISCLYITHYSDQKKETLCCLSEDIPVYFTLFTTQNMKTLEKQ